MFLNNLTLQQKEAFYRLAYSVAVSDGEVTNGEKLMLEEMKREMNLSAKTQGTYQEVRDVIKLFDSRSSRTIALISMIRVGFADGAYEIEEQCYIDDVRRVFEFSDADFNLITNWVKRLVSLQQEVRAFI